MRPHRFTTFALAPALALGALSAAVAQETQPTTEAATQPADTEMAAPAPPATAPTDAPDYQPAVEMTSPAAERHPDIVGIIVCFAQLDESMIGNRCTVEGYLLEKTEDTVTVADDHNHVATLPIEGSTAALEPGDFVRGTGEIVAGDEGPTVELESMYHVILSLEHGDTRTPHPSSHIDPATIEPVPY